MTKGLKYFNVTMINLTIQMYLQTKNVAKWSIAISAFADGQSPIS